MSNLPQAQFIYRKKQAETAKQNWRDGVYDFKRAGLETRVCCNSNCNNKFEVKSFDSKRFCSKKCAAHVNNQGRVHSRETKLKIANALSLVPVNFLKSEIVKEKKQLPDPFVISREDLIKLYCDQLLSSGEIGDLFNVSNHQVIKKLKKYKIPRRTPAESNNIKYMKQPPTYNFKNNLTEDERLLYNSAVMLYWAEGGKKIGGKDRNAIDFINSDDRMVKLFLKALREVFRIDESKLRVYLFCYANQDVSELTNFWSKLLNVPKKQFTKPYVRKDFKTDKIGKLPYGVIHLRYNDKKLFMQIMAEVDIMSRK